MAWLGFSGTGAGERQQGTEAAATAGGNFRNHLDKRHCFTDEASYYLDSVPPMLDAHAVEN